MINDQEHPEEHPLGNLRKWKDIEDELYGLPGTPEREDFEKAALQDVAEGIATGSASPITADDMHSLTISSAAEYHVAVIERDSLSEATDPIQKARFLQLATATTHYKHQHSL